MARQCRTKSTVFSCPGCQLSSCRSHTLWRFCTIVGKCWLRTRGEQGGVLAEREDTGYSSWWGTERRASPEQECDADLFEEGPDAAAHFCQAGLQVGQQCGQLGRICHHRRALLLRGHGAQILLDFLDLYLPSLDLHGTTTHFSACLGRDKSAPLST